jgi:hypothetical protein
MPDFPQRGQEIIDALYAQNVALATGDLDQQRLLTRLIAEQISFELGPRWGIKAASPTRPPGPSELAFNAPPLYIYRWSDGDGHVTGLPGSPLHPPLLMPLDQSRGQVFIPVDPVDHLRVSDTRPPPRSDPPAPPVDLAPLLARIAVLEQTVNALASQMPVVADDAHEALHRRYPRYVAKVKIPKTPWTITIVSYPEGS